MRPLDDTTPTVTVCSKCSGLPMAQTQSPTRKAVGVAQGHGGQVLALDLEQGEVGAGVGAHEACGQLALVGQAHPDLPGPETT